MNEGDAKHGGARLKVEDRRQGSRQPIAIVTSLGKTPRVPRWPGEGRERAKKRAPAERRTAQKHEHTHRHATGDEPWWRHRQRMPHKGGT